MKKAIKFSLFITFFCTAALQTIAQNIDTNKKYEIWNRWKDGEWLYVALSQPRVGSCGDEYCFREWVFEAIPGTKLYKISSYFGGGHLYVEAGKVKFGTIKPGWLTAQWEIVPVFGDYVRLKNVRSGKFLHIEKGILEVGFLIGGGMWSAQWVLKPVGE